MWSLSMSCFSFLSWLDNFPVYRIFDNTLYKYYKLWIQNWTKTLHVFFKMRAFLTNCRYTKHKKTIRWQQMKEKNKHCSIVIRLVSQRTACIYEKYHFYKVNSFFFAPPRMIWRSNMCARVKHFFGVFKLVFALGGIFTRLWAWFDFEKKVLLALFLELKLSSPEK